MYVHFNGFCWTFAGVLSAEPWSCEGQTTWWHCHSSIRYCRYRRSVWVSKMRPVWLHVDVQGVREGGGGGRDVRQNTKLCYQLSWFCLNCRANLPKLWPHTSFSFAISSHCVPTGGTCLVCLTLDGHMLAFSLPSLTPLLDFEIENTCSVDVR